MFVYIQLCQCADINLEFILIGEAFRQFGIQAVDPLDDQHIICAQSFWFISVFFVPCHKIKGWDHHFLAGQQFFELLVKKLHIHRFQTFKIISSRLISWILLPLYEIIIHRDRVRN